ncbi:MAG: hypothetical protein GXP42_16085 [Chloroflexi bacterium]|nr:hypothetical protein [Chloroflexota bacterium]
MLNRKFLSHLVMAFLPLLGLLVSTMQPPSKMEARPLEPAAPDSVAKTAAGPIFYFSVTPLVLDPARDEPVQIQVYAQTTVDAIQFVTKQGASMSFIQESQGVFTLTLSSSTALAQYNPQHDVQRHWAGYLHVYGNGVELAKYLMLFNVADENVPNVPVALLASDVQASPHLVNIRLPAYFPDLNGAEASGRPSPSTKLANRFYEFFGDDYDFLLILQEPSKPANRHYIGVRNDIAGIGTTLYDSSADYGSQGRLQGLIYFPLSTYYDLAESTFSHELGHRWMVFLKNIPELLGIGPHWPVSSLASGIMGFNTKNSAQGLNFPYEVVAIGDGNYRLEPAEIHRFTDVELYLMGLIPASEVGEHVVFVDQEQTLCAGCILQGPVSIFEVDDIIEAYGPREPAYPYAQTEFNVAAIFVTRDRLLSPREMAFFDYFTARGEATEPMATHIGAAWGVEYPFYLATGGRAAVQTSLIWDAPPWSSLHLPFLVMPH